MGKGKLEKFADMREYPHVFEYPYSVAESDVYKRQPLFGGR